MERKIGEVFEFGNIKLKVVLGEMCNGCHFEGKCKRSIVNVRIGECSKNERKDKKNVIFVKYEQQPEGQEADAETVNLLKILNNCPCGTAMYSPVLGHVAFDRMSEKYVYVSRGANNVWAILPNGHYEFRDGQITDECVLWPSKDKRTWEGVEYKPTLETLPKTWDEFVKYMGYDPTKFTFQETHTAILDVMLTEENTYRDCNQHIAMIKLHALRNLYRMGWKPEERGEFRVIKIYDGKLKVLCYENTGSFLLFKDVKTAQVFLDRFKDIIEEAGDMI